LEWDLPVGPMRRPMSIPMLLPPIRLGHGGVAGEEAGVAAGVVVAAGVGLYLTGTRGGKNMKTHFLKEVKHA
jgi:hypothetical protein